MKQFISQVSRFLLFAAIISSCISLILFAVPAFTPVAEIPEDDYSEILKSDIIIAGDSRANRQIDPGLLHQYTAMNAINISQSVHDLYAVSKILKALNIRNKTLVLSASSWQLNDGAITEEYFRVESFGDLSCIDKFILYRKNIVTLYKRQLLRFTDCMLYKTSIRNFYDHRRKINTGYEGVSCDNKEVSAKFALKDHPFYFDPNLQGIKRKLMIKALQNLKELKGCRILIFNGPVTTAFRNEAKKMAIYKMETSYDAMMKSLTRSCKNIRYVSYLNDTTIPDSEFNDIQHICESAVPIFTKMITKEINLWHRDSQIQSSHF